jgi:DNA-binding MarR family transcriptional regulator
VDEAVQLRRAVNSLARTFNATATDEGLTPSQASVLGLIVGHGPVGVTELARMEHINPTMLSRVLGKLDEEGLVKRSQDPEDLRAAMLEATSAGKRVHNRVKTQRADLILHGVSRLPAAEQAAIRDALIALESLAAAMR